MKAQFKRPCAIDNKEYPVGIHEIPENQTDHWYLNALIEQGDVILIDGERQREALQGSKSPPQANKSLVGNQVGANDTDAFGAQNAIGTSAGKPKLKNQTN